MAAVIDNHSFTLKQQGQEGQRHLSNREEVDIERAPEVRDSIVGEWLYIHFTSVVEEIVKRGHSLPESIDRGGRCQLELFNMDAEVLKIKYTLERSCCCDHMPSSSVEFSSKCIADGACRATCDQDDFLCWSCHRFTRHIRNQHEQRCYARTKKKARGHVERGLPPTKPASTARLTKVYEVVGRMDCCVYGRDRPVCNVSDGFPRMMAIREC